MLNPQTIKSLLSDVSYVSEILYYEELDSTSDYIKKNDLYPDTLVITNFQKSGRGRFQNKWESAKGKNLTFSILKKFSLKENEQVNLVYLFSYSIYSALKKYTKKFNKEDRINSLVIKWPNDILLNNKKIAGVLIEKKSGSNNYIIGIGININQNEFSKELSNTSTSLLIETKKETDLNLILKDIIIESIKNTELLIHYKYLEIYNLWKNSTESIGKEVYYITSKGDKNMAIIRDYLPAGKIVLFSKGEEYTFNSGEIKLQF